MAGASFADIEHDDGSHCEPKHLNQSELVDTTPSFGSDLMMKGDWSKLELIRCSKIDIHMDTVCWLEPVVDHTSLELGDNIYSPRLKDWSPAPLNCYVPKALKKLPRRYQPLQ